MKKYLCHVPTEQYGFISVELEGTADEAVIAYRELSRAYQGGAGVPTGEWNALLDELLSKGSIAGDPGVVTQMTPEQNRVFQEIKKSMARIKRLNG